MFDDYFVKRSMTGIRANYRIANKLN